MNKSRLNSLSIYNLRGGSSEYNNITNFEEVYNDDGKVEFIRFEGYGETFKLYISGIAGYSYK